MACKNKNMMKSIITKTAIVAMALLAFVACGDDDVVQDVEVVVPGGSTGDVEGQMTQAPARVGWSGSESNGVCYYMFSGEEAYDAKASLLARVDDFDDDDDEDDDDEDFDCKVFCSFSLANGSVNAGSGKARLCFSFSNEGIAAEAYESLRSGAFDDDEEGLGIDSVAIYAITGGVRRTGNTVWYALDNLNGLSVRELKACMSVWEPLMYHGMSGFMMNAINNIVGLNMLDIETPVFGSWSSNGSYVSNAFANEPTLTEGYWEGYNKMTIAPVDTLQSHGYEMVLECKSQEVAQNTYNAFTHSTIYGVSFQAVSILGKRVSLTVVGKDYSEAVVRNCVKFMDITVNMPFVLQLATWVE